MRANRRIHLADLCGLACLLAWLPLASSSAQNYAIDWYKVSGGGGSSSNGLYTISGTIGQHDAGGPLTSANYSLTGGFWALYAVQLPGLPALAIKLVQQPRSVVVSWPNAGNYVLQTNSSLSAPAWIGYAGPIQTANGTNSVTISPPDGKLFFRLNNPVY
jgi:hypothetical protein